MSGSQVKLCELDDSGQLPDRIEIGPSGPIWATVTPPGSKSITNRALVVSALACGTSELHGVLDSEDTRVMIECCRGLGLGIVHDPVAATVRLNGCAGSIPRQSADLYCANSGTTIRFMSALAALGHGSYRLDGTQRMRQRPIEDLLVALRNCGAQAHSELGNGCPPILVTASGLRGGRVEVSGTVSSQYVSALLMVAPYCAEPLRLVVMGELVSAPFVAMTRAVMADFGVSVLEPVLGEFVIPAGQSYVGGRYYVEPDATAASYFWAAAAITGGTVTVQGIGDRSCQGDCAFVDLLERMGAGVERGPESITVSGRVLHGIDTSMKAISDTFITLAAVAAFADSPTRIRGVAHSRVQETDRVHAVALELARLGLRVQEHDDGLTIHPGGLRSAEVETYDDHRIAMSMSLIGLRIPGVVIRNPACVQKTYPRFFHDLKSQSCTG